MSTKVKCRIWQFDELACGFGGCREPQQPVPMVFPGLCPPILGMVHQEHFWHWYKGAVLSKTLD
ncbi:MAG: hypothetical protein ABIH21_04680 [Patescibacteria group bacterium]